MGATLVGDAAISIAEGVTSIVCDEEECLARFLS
jgi:hypothetical protein